MQELSKIFGSLACYTKGLKQHSESFGLIS